MSTHKCVTHIHKSFAQLSTTFPPLSATGGGAGGLATPAANGALADMQSIVLRGGGH